MSESSPLDDEDKYDELINFQSVRNEDDLETAVSVQWPGTDRPLHISTLLKQEDIAPLFDGAQWAGTRVWHAAVAMFQFLHENHANLLKGPNIKVLELGCGLGVPGMFCYQVFGAETYLTDQESLLGQMQENLDSNFPLDSLGGPSGCERRRIRACALDWSRQAVVDFMTENSLAKIDVVINCDCVYEPLYGESWKLLADVIDELLRANPNALVLSSVERRQADSVDTFLLRMSESTSVSSVDKVWVDENAKIEIYRTRGVGSPTGCIT